MTHLLEIWKHPIPTPRGPSTKETSPPIIVLFRTSVNDKTIDTGAATEKITGDYVCGSIS
jgi:hypothetical protein